MVILNFDLLTSEEVLWLLVLYFHPANLHSRGARQTDKLTDRQID